MRGWQLCLAQTQRDDRTMLSLRLSNVASSSYAAHSAKSLALSLHAFPSLSSFSFSLHQNPSSRLRSRFLTKFSASSRLAESRGGDCSSDDGESFSLPTGNYAGVKLQETVDTKSGKLRLDAWISSRINGVSRARVQSSIRSGLVAVNGRVVDKVSHSVRAGDKVDCVISELQPLIAEPEDIPVDMVYEDEHVLVVNKPAHMVVHPAPGNASGTLVNAILHHCSLPTVAFSDTQLLSEAEDVSDDESSSVPTCNVSTKGLNASTLAWSVRPGIVHRLDKGTSGLLVVAKNEQSHAHLSEQFKLHTIQRVYVSLTSGVPSATSGRIEVPIGRDINNRIRMAAIPGPSNGGQACYAASRYKVIEVLAGGSSALVEWRLETGRTHQIRAHAKYMGVPLVGDEVYGGTKNLILSLLQAKLPPNQQSKFSQLVSLLERPCLHAFSLGFIHPYTEKLMQFSCQPPEDFAEILRQLRKLGVNKPSFKHD